MADKATAFREALQLGDVDRLRQLWAALFPHLPQPQDRMEATVVLHQARTAANSVTIAARQYSHRWLREQGYRSDLPYELKSKAEQQGRPVIVEAVGISVGSMDKSPGGRERTAFIRKSMEKVVHEMFGAGETDPVLMRRRMMEARSRARRL